MINASEARQMTDDSVKPILSRTLQNVEELIFSSSRMGFYEVEIHEVPHVVKSTLKDILYDQGYHVEHKMNSLLVSWY